MRKARRCFQRAVVVLSILLMQLLVTLFVMTVNPSPLICRKEPYSVLPPDEHLITRETRGVHIPYTNCYDVLDNSSHVSRESLVITCDNNTSYSRQTEFVSDSQPFSVPFKDPCLGLFIQQHCYGRYRVPNVVHYVWFSRNVMDVFGFLSILSVQRFLKPCVILVHADVLPHGPYWKHVLRLVPNIVHVHRQAPETIYGKRFGYVQHKSDIARIELLTEYGGVYLDNDQLVLKSLDSFRNYSFVMGHENSNNLGNSLLISEKGAKFLDIWYKTYRSYNPKQWGIHSTFVPFTLAKIYPTLIHIENESFIKPDLGGINQLYGGHYNWSNNYAVHLYTRWVKKFYTIQDLKYLNSSLGEISRLIMFGFATLCSDSN
ncbi:uncharacterized protein LOC121376553 [Gigantopelta aegis]|uniref:uncharacterized protein LOC121376553 n=1 Tax=Gigantopelta aegis TaxID=1735272 RepID=UPI001B88A695|nr:uncharacterized protein LOC121376553 [Gigantopelta aegis]